ncbi:MAG TPA: carboxypeptidase-like regulatory domain-containing protein, partial [Chitinophagaceae bacterium]|nr:carboxypeptidase-like regulatory domain-containing protein [Chitinophagaceae bacterium]
MKGKSIPESPAAIRSFFSFLLLLLLSPALYSQTVTGKVTDENGKALVNVTVAVKGTSTGVTSDESGQYRITAASTATLVFSSVGHTTLEVKIDGRSVLNVSLLSATKDLNEVVVITALGISKQARGLGYSATNVKPEDLTVNRTTNPINALQGKVAGVNISTMGTGP